VLAWLWLDVALAARGHAREDGTRAAMRFFFAHELPKVDAWLAVVASRDDTARSMRDEWF
jgi:butyryl-CoA dehydrogenase